MIPPLHTLMARGRALNLASSRPNSPPTTPPPISLNASRPSSPPQTKYAEPAIRPFVLRADPNNPRARNPARIDSRETDDGCEDDGIASSVGSSTTPTPDTGGVLHLPRRCIARRSHDPGPRTEGGIRLVTGDALVLDQIREDEQRRRQARGLNLRTAEAGWFPLDAVDLVPAPPSPHPHQNGGVKSSTSSAAVRGVRVPTTLAELDQMLLRGDVTGPEFIALRKVVADLVALDEALCKGDVQARDYIARRDAIMESAG
ncbi:hypothetical protein BDK51DRAFT_35136 [Blyttiomyces helicus]|uniref:Uncharacterized protein n=1 Tax=Blyttiomyces helicus TaxID=388810 RepID=A0A4P9WMR8_9FUNG|nr:hypothetical protein BDK51DRAFT_35136 [Blyttiomyces helicus]|eukprot:RKO93792.1 hypothetical protein BDK51DRAFT_35136 [Blyttiomyces helicus]